MPNTPHDGTHPKENGKPFDARALASTIQQAVDGRGGLRLPSPPPVSERIDGGHRPQGNGKG